MFGLYLTLGILAALVLFLGYAALRPKLKGYRLVWKRTTPKRHVRPKAKKKHIWIKVM